MKLLPRSRRPSIEPLEVRVVPAAVFWDGGAGSNDWANPLNWSNDALPTADDHVTIDAPGDVTVSLSAGTHSVASLSVVGGDLLSLSGGSLTLLGASSTSKLTMTGGVLAIPGGLELTFFSTLAGGEIRDGTLTNDTGAQLNLTGGFLRGVTLQNEGIVTQSAVSYGMFTNFAGTVGSVIQNRPGGVWTLAHTSGQTAFNAAAFASFDNEGTLRRDGPGTVEFSNLFYVQKLGGEIEIATGNLTFSGSGSLQGGSFDMAAGTAVAFAPNPNFGHSFTVSGTLTGNGPGTVQLASGNIHGFAGAVLDFPAGVIFHNGATLRGTWENTGVLQITGGFMSDATLTNSDTVTQPSGSFTATSTTITNKPGAVWEVRQAGGGSAATGGGAPSVFQNEGTLRRDGTGTLEWGSLPYVQKATGEIEVAAGNLAFSSSGELQGGSFDIAAGSGVFFQPNSVFGHSFTVSGTLTGTGPGTVNFQNGNIHGTADAVLNFPAGVAFLNAATLRGTWQNTGVFQITGGFVSGATFTNTGTVVQPSGTVTVSDGSTGGGPFGSVIANKPGGVWELRQAGGGSAAFGGGGLSTFQNEGTVLRDTTGTIEWGSLPYVQKTTGKIETATGSVAFSSSGDLQGGSFDVKPGTTVFFQPNAIFGQSFTISGRLTGGGGGTVNLQNGNIFGTAASSLDFSSGTLQLITATLRGTHTNTGELTTFGGFLSDGSFVNAGTVKQRNTLNLSGTSPAGSATNLAGGLWVFENTTDTFMFTGSLNSGFRNEGLLRRDGPNSSFFTGGPAFTNVAGAEIEVLNGNLTHASGTLTLEGARFDVRPGAAVTFTGGTTLVHGTLTGEGGGQVTLLNATLRSENTARLDFPPGMFAQLAGVLRGTWENTGSITVSGGFWNNAVFTNHGAVTQNGPIRMQSNSVTEPPTTIVNAADGAWNLALATAFTSATSAEASGVSFTNLGSITRNGTNQIFFGTLPLDNRGTIETIAGDLTINGPLIQRGATALTGGEWRVGSGTTLDLSFTALAQSDAAIAVDGTGVFSRLGQIAVNNGSIALIGGADMTRGAAAFTNNGSLLLGPGSTLTAGTFTQTAGADIEFQVAGLSNVGQLVIAGAASFAGRANVTVQPGFIPQSGQTITLATYAPANATFTPFDGLSLARTPVFSPTYGATALTLNTLVSAADLAVESITIPAGGIAGQDFTFSYTVKNNTTAPTLISSWTDTVYLSRDGVLDSTDIVLARVTHNGVVVGGGSYVENVTVPLVGAIPGNWRIIVAADSRGYVADADRANNTGASGGVFALDVPALTPGAAFNGTIKHGQDLFFRVTLPPGATPSFTLTGGVNGVAEMFTTLGGVPTRATFMDSAFERLDDTARILSSTNAGGTYYVLLHGRENAGAGQTFSLTVSGLGFDLATTSLATGSNAGRVTTTLSGSQFTPGTTFTLVDGAVTRAASAVYFVDARTVHATFDLTGLALGTYDIVADNGTATDTLTDAFTVTNAAAGRLKSSMSSPRYIRPPFGGSSVITITYENIGHTDLDAPLFTLLGDNALLRLPGDDAFLPAAYTTGRNQLSAYELLGVSGGLAGVLEPGEKATIQVLFQPIQDFAHAFSNFQLIVGPQDSTPYSLARSKADMRPAGVSAEAWDAIFANLESAVGTTVGSYRAMLVDNANYLGQFGPVSPDTGKLLQFELEQAGAFGAIASRHTLGIFGRGNADLFSLRALTGADGSITLTDGSSAAFFARNSDGSFAQAGPESGVLTKDGAGAVTVTNPGGGKTVFRASDGRIDFVEDANSNRLTATWNASGQLTALTNSLNGDTTTYAYNAQGRVATATDPVGRVTTYGYDASGEHLTSVTSPQGTVNYTYVTGQGAAREHALASVTSVDGVTTTYSYDAQGRLTQQQTGSGPGAIVTTYAYDSAGRVTITDAAGRATNVYQTALGLAARTVDADGDAVTARYDDAGRLLSVTDPAGLTSKSILDASGRVIGSIRPDGGKTLLDFGGTPTRVTSVTDAGGGVTSLSYDTKGNLTAAILPDGSTDRLEYDASGRVTASTDANGIRTTYTYSAAGLVTGKQTSNGESFAYTYDAHRNLLTATDSGGTTTYTYDAADRITSVAYPNGKSVAFTYDAFGRQATVADQSGYTVRYSYDALGRLDEVRDTANALLVEYAYNATGQLATETRGNGSTTTYTYDGAGHIASITHRDAANVVTGFFQYTYDSRDRVTTATTEDGTTTYAYDLRGQLASVALPGGRTIQYQYDAQGNRIAVVDSQTGTENYATNSGGQVVSAGGETFTYDPNGRLISSTEGGVTTSYTYNAAAQLTAVTSPGSVVTYDYDALGNRIGRVENGVRTDFAVDPTGLGSVFGEYNGGATIANYAQGIGLAARIAGGSAAFYHFDAIGNTSLVSGAAGAALATYDYLPFGEITAQTGTLANPFTFGGRVGVVDEIGDTYSMRARTYDSDTGRFTSRDPIGFFAGDTNLYRFGNNNPVSFNDPTGFFPVGSALEGLSLPSRPGGLPTGIGGRPYLPMPGAGPVPAPVPAPVPPAPVPVTGPAGPYLPIPGQTPPVPAPTAPITPPGAPPQPLMGPNGPYLPGPGEPVPPPASVAGGASALELVGPGAVVFLGAALAIDGGELLFDSAGLGNLVKTKPQDVLTKGVSKLRNLQGSSELFNDLYKVGREGGKSDRDATLDAITFLRKNGIYDPVFNPDPTSSEVIRPNDPNNIIGPFGSGADPLPEIIGPGQVRFDGFVNGRDDFAYTIQFENQASASAPAQVVRVTQTLDADLDLATFRFGSFGWGDFKITAPAKGDGTSFHALVDATATLGVNVQVDAELNTLTRELTVVFTSLDPQTNEVPANPLLGFLPPDNDNGDGDGFITYTVAPKTGLANGTRFDALASIVFDTENPIATPDVHNTLDSVAPTSAVQPLAATTQRSTFVVRWTAEDDAAGSGLAGVTLYFTDNGGPLQTATIANAGGGFRFTGEVGHTYAFYTQGVDNVGNLEAVAATPGAIVTVVAPTFVGIGKKKTFTDADGDKFTIKFSGPGTAKAALLDLDGDQRGAIDFLQIDGSTKMSKISITVKKAPGGDGVVSIGDVLINGALGAFTAKKSDLVVNGLTASGGVKAIAVRDLLQPDVLLANPLVQLAGGTTDRTTLAARTLADGFTITTPGSITKLSAHEVGRGQIIAATLQNLEVKTGDLRADIRLSGVLGPVSIKQGGIRQASITAAAIGDVTVKGDVLSAIILAGADLGEDGLLGGGDDTFAPGRIGKVNIGGSVTASVLGAGLSSADAVFKNADDLILGGAASRIASLTVKGQADAASYFAAGLFKKAPKIAGTVIDPATDPRFLVG